MPPPPLPTPCPGSSDTRPFERRRRVDLAALAALFALSSSCGGPASSGGAAGAADSQAGTDGATSIPGDAAAPSTGKGLPASDAGTGDDGADADAGAASPPGDGSTGDHAASPGPVTDSGRDGALPAGEGGAPSDAAARDATPGGDGGAVNCESALGAGPVTTSATHLDIGVHDPSMIWDGTRYFLFATGGTLGVRSSADMRTWTGAGNVLPAVPAWITTALGATPASLWAPDVSYFGGVFHVYYAGSSFGSNDSVIGLATTPSLRAPSWTDQGLVVRSQTTDDFNAIDPNVSFDETCAPWLAYGSFWSGIKLRKLDAATGMPSADDPTTYAIASRNGGAIEAASIISHGGFYYLFVSFDACCKGVNSTYRTMVGRAARITGPYTDKAGTDMMKGAAEQLLASSGRYIGPGGGTAFRNGDTYLYAFHYYDGQDNGASKLEVRPITFDASDWVVLGEPLFP